MTIANELGLRKTTRFNLGVFAGFVVIILLCSYLDLALSGLVPRIRLVASVVGAGYMLYLAAKVIWSNHAQAGGGGVVHSFWADLGLQFFNVKVMMYGITAVSSFVLPYTHSQAGPLRRGLPAPARRLPYPVQRGDGPAARVQRNLCLPLSGGVGGGSIIMYQGA
ncbi:MAG: LysE family translocator [Symbiobacteriia bacterium]